MLCLYCLVSDGKLSGMYEKPFMADVAKQDFQKYNIRPHYPQPVLVSFVLIILVHFTKN